MKRILVTGDWHCGHVVGLTPPEWQYQEIGERYHDKYARIQHQMWEWFVAKINLHRPIDRLIINGDAIEGKGARSGGTELLTADRIRQGEMAERIVREIGADEIAMTFGTPYHVGLDEDMETIIADKIGCSIESHLERTVEGVRIDARHYVASSSTPYGQYTPLSKEDLWRVMWAERSEKFAPHLVIRSHVHKFDFCGNEFSTVIAAPCMQGLGSKFGSRKCSKTVSIGFLIIDCEDGKYTWDWEILPLKEQVSAWKPW